MTSPPPALEEPATRSRARKKARYLGKAECGELRTYRRERTGQQRRRKKEEEEGETEKGGREGGREGVREGEKCAGYEEGRKGEGNE